MLTLGADLLLVSEELELFTEVLAGGRGDDNFIDETTGSGDKRVGKALLVVLSLLLNVLATEDNLDGTLGTHDGNLGGRPGDVAVRLEVLGGHHIVSTTICLSGDDSELGHSGLSIGVEKLGTVANDTVVLLGGSGKESGYIDKGDEGDVEGITEAHEAGSLDRGVNVKAAGKLERLVTNDTDGASVKATETDNDVFGELGLDLQKLALVNYLLDDDLHVVGHVGVLRNDHVEGRVSASA